MTDLLLNACGDLDFSNVRLHLVGGADAVRQRWLFHIRTLLGEWFLDTTIGVPYLQRVLKKTITREVLKQVFTVASAQVPGILQVVSVIVDDLNVATREATVSVTCIIDGAEGPETGVFKFTGTVPPNGCSIAGPAPPFSPPIPPWTVAANLLCWIQFGGGASEDFATIMDLSGNNLDWTQSTAAIRPTPDTFRTLPVARFDYTKSQFFNGGTYDPATDAAEIFIVIKKDADPGPTGSEGLWNLGFGINGQQYPRSDNVVTADAFDSSTHTFSSASLNLDSIHIYNVTTEGITWTGRIDETGSALVTQVSEVQGGFTDAVNTVFGKSTNRTGGSVRHWGGIICEWVAFDNDLTSGEREQVRAYLANKWIN